MAVLLIEISLTAISIHSSVTCVAYEIYFKLHFKINPLFYGSVSELGRFFYKITKK
jgi:hypothetical protein